MKKGFTLMELMVVIAIMGLLITVGIASYKSTQAKSRDNRRKSDLAAVGRALELYYNDNGVYPPDNGAGKLKACGASPGAACTWGGNQFNNEPNGKATTVYMVKLPADPAANFTYYYQRSGGYQLYARLENFQDSDYSATIVAKNINCGADDECNYGIASSNTTP